MVATEKKAPAAGPTTAQNKLMLGYQEKLSTSIKRIMNSFGDSARYIESYKVEGLTGRYSTLPNAKGDEFEKDHQPQNAARDHLGKRPYWKSTTAGKKLQNTGAGWSILVHENRHDEGKTGGGKGSSTLATFKGLITAEEGKFTPTMTPAQKRAATLPILAKELSDDTKAMKKVMKNGLNHKAWRDIKALPISASEKNTLRSNITNQMNSGESQIATQDLLG